jgi:medium-chain acyl-[acyl-carrier-protein] hydrolase
MTKSIRFILDKEFCVTSAETDFSHHLKVSSLVNMFIQIAWQHAEELGFGKSYLHQQNLAWVLSKLHLKIDSLPQWSETIKLVTWPKGINRLFYLRDLEVHDKNDNQITCGTSEWLLIDTKSKRPKLEGADEDIFSKNKDKHAIETLIPNLKPIANDPVYFPFRAKYSDIDLNQHYTATRYIDQMFNTFDLDFFKKNECTEIVLNFIREIPYGTEVLVKKVFDVPTNCHEFEFVEKVKGEILFRGKIWFKAL